jgi:hypothetical protein
MHFTHITPGSPSDAAVVASTLQIFSVKVAEIKEAIEFNWPLHVYGMVAARDTVDHSRNILFLRERCDCQILTQKVLFNFIVKKMAQFLFTSFCLHLLLFC